MQTQNFDSVNYVETVEKVAKYAVRIGGVDAFYVLVDESDPELKIQVTNLDGSKVLDTKGRAKMITDFTADVDGVPQTVHSHAAGSSVRSYLRGRVSTFIARLYIPGFEQDAPASE